MIRSMTAFSRVSRSKRGCPWTVEIRSLNHRFFDFSVRMPPDYLAYEGQIRDLVKGKMARGKVTVSVSRTNGDTQEALTLDEDAVDKYLRAIRRLKRRFGTQGDVTTDDLIKLPRLFTSKKVKEPVAKGWSSLRDCLQAALAQAIRAKQSEGKKTFRDIVKRLDSVGRAVKRIQKHTAKMPQLYFDKLKSRLAEILERETARDDRLWHEVAILADRSDIAEELARLQGHIVLFRSRLRSTAEIGRELDFLCQEMNREVNTIGSKAQFFDISREVVYLKGEIEKIREQVQNVE